MTADEPDPSGRGPDAHADKPRGPATPNSRGPATPNPRDLAIDVHDLHKTYGARKVVDGLTLAVKSGEICGFLGANGSGKTTTIRMLCGLVTPDGGGGTCLGLDILRDAPRSGFRSAT